MSDPLKVLITVAPNAREALDAIVDELQESGLRLEAILRPIGVIVGSARREMIPRFRSIRGVASVEADHPVRIAL